MILLFAQPLLTILCIDKDGHWGVRIESALVVRRIKVRNPEVNGYGVILTSARHEVNSMDRSGLDLSG